MFNDMDISKYRSDVPFAHYPARGERQLSGFEISTLTDPCWPKVFML